MSNKTSFQELREDEREKRKSIILDSAVKLFKNNVLHQVGMRDIADEAGISAATIYRYFPSRDDIIVEALLQDINAIEKRLDVILADGEGDIKDMAISVLDYFIDNQVTFQMMCYFLTSGTVGSDVLRKFTMIQEYFFNMFSVKLKSRGIAYDVLFLQAFFASITGVVLTFLHYPGLSEKEKRAHMHKLALAIIQGGGSLSVD